MSATTPLVFRPSFAQRAVSGLLFAGSWIVGIRILVLVIDNFPRMLAALELARVTSEPTFWPWIHLVASIAACLLGGLLLALSLVVMLVVEGTHVLIDELGMAVEYVAVPRRLARWIGAGRLAWKEIQSLEKHRLFFVIRAGLSEPGKENPSLLPVPVLRFLMVDELESLVLLIIERSPNLKL